MQGFKADFAKNKVGLDTNSSAFGATWTLASDELKTLIALTAIMDRQEARTVLVITRREGEEVVIGDPSAPLGVVRIASIKGDRVRVAFEFPRTIEVHRREVADQIIAGEKNEQSVVGKIRPAAGEGG